MALNLESLFNFLKSDPSEQDCINYFEKLRRKDKVISPFDPKSKVYKCKNTRKYFTRANVKEGSNIYTDEWYRHGDLYKDFNHGIVNHSLNQHTKGKTSTNTIENP